MEVFKSEQVVLHGPHLVEASAGTGKTFSITTLYLRLILELGLRTEQILVVTFTEAATAELKERIRSRLRACLDGLADPAKVDPTLSSIVKKCGTEQAQLRLRAALFNFDEAAIFTIHGFCMRMLRDGAFESGLPFDAELMTSQQTLLDSIVDDYRVNRRYDRTPFVVDHLDAKVNGLDLRRLAAQAAENSDILLLPKEVGASPDAQALDDHQVRFQKMRQLWQGCDAEISRLLQEGRAQGLVKGASEKNLDAWLAGLDAFLQPSELPGLSIPNQFKRFCTGLMEANKGKTPPSHAFFDACQAFNDSHEALEPQLDNLVDQFKLDLVAEVWQQLPARKAETSQLSFQDLLCFLDRALSNGVNAPLVKIIRDRFPAAMIDEFQDTDAVQYRIFRNLFLYGQHPLFLIGDPKQAIYSFRGADIYTYLQAVQDTQRHCYTMDTNYRSDPSLIAGVNELFRHHTNPFRLKDISFPKVVARGEASDRFPRTAEYPAPLTLTYLPQSVFLGEGNAQERGISIELAEREIPKWLAARVVGLLQSDLRIESKPIVPSDIAILVRKNKQAQAIRRALVACGVPCVSYSNDTIFQTDEARELALLLKAIVEPSRSAYVKVALCTSLLGQSANDIMDLEHQPELWEQRISQFRDWKDLWQNHGFIQMFRSLITEVDLHARLFSRPDGERAMTNLLHLSELLQEAANREHLGAAGLLVWLSKQETNPDEESGASELRLESDARAVTIITIHRSKGLEYPIVFCPYLWGGDTLPKTRSSLVYRHPEEQARVLDVRQNPDDLAEDQAKLEAAAEGLRLLYVAVTRARHYLEVFLGPISGLENSPLAHLLFNRDGSASDKLLREICHDDASLLHILQDQVAQTQGNWTLVEVTGPPPKLSYNYEQSYGTLSLRSFEQRLRASRRNTSFSQLTHKAIHHELVPARDHDELVPDSDLNPAIPTRAEESAHFQTFPKGAKAGIFFHSVLEHIDFATVQPDQLQLQVALELRKAGFRPELGPTACEGLSQILKTPMQPDGSMRLADIPASQRLNELEFLFPIATSGESEETRLLTAGKLAEVFRQWGEGLPASYPDELAELAFTPLLGYMKGFIDLIFQHEQRWYLVDYKSNHLGNHFQDYAAAHLVQPMAESHYFLQYHIYTLALHRFLARVVRGYDYESHFGGVYYLFIKGMDPGLGSDYGVFFDRPPLQRIQALSDLVGQPRQGGRP